MEEHTNLRARFDIYAKAINQIDDFFEYRYKVYRREQTKKFVMRIIDNITRQLKNETNIRN